LPALRRVHCPFLALRGGVDDPVGGKLATAAMRKALSEAGNRNDATNPARKRTRLQEIRRARGSPEVTRSGYRLATSLLRLMVPEPEDMHSGN